MQAQRRPMAKPLSVYAGQGDRNSAMAVRYLSGGYTMKEIAVSFGAHYMTASRAVRLHQSSMSAAMLGWTTDDALPAATPFFLCITGLCCIAAPQDGVAAPGAYIPVGAAV
jgi:hypothetical protein